MDLYDDYGADLSLSLHADSTPDGYNASEILPADAPDVERYMPCTVYNPHIKPPGEGKAIDEKKEKKKQRRFDLRRHALRKHLQEVAIKNTDPSRLEMEMNEAIQAHKASLREKRYSYPRSKGGEISIEALMAQRRATTTPEEIEYWERRKYKRKDQKNAYKLRKDYKNASESERVAIIYRASQVGLTLDDLTRPKYAFPGRSVIGDTSCSNAAHEAEGERDDVGEQVHHVNEEDPDYLPSDWLSLGLSK